MKMLESITEALLKNIINNDYKGYDPYDAMESRIINRKLNRRTLIMLTQLNRLSPLNIRPLLKIRPLHNSKANGILLHSFLNLDRPAEEEIENVVNMLVQYKSRYFEEYSIGFNYDITLRHYTSLRNEPSLIITLFVMYAFIKYYRNTGREDIFEHIISFSRLLDNKLPGSETESTLWYSYNFDKINEIYNATAKIGKFYYLLYQIQPREELLIKIRKILNYLQIKQRDDGSWAYGEKIDYTDGFHTAFVLEAIWYMLKLVESDSYLRMFEKGMQHYKQKLFSDEAQPLYFHPDYEPDDFRRHIIETDIRDCAMAIILFSRAGQRERATRVLEWTINNMYSSNKGYFYYYRNGLWTNKIRFIRWQAWMLYAISVYCENS